MSDAYTGFPHLQSAEQKRTKSRYKVAPKVAPEFPPNSCLGAWEFSSTAGPAGSVAATLASPRLLSELKTELSNAPRFDFGYP